MRREAGALSRSRLEGQMPKDSILISIGVCLLFLLFAFLVAWADHATSQWLSKRATAKQATACAEPP
jgi:hypothetical protein